MENLSEGMSLPSPDPALFRNDDDAPLKVESLEQLNLNPEGRFFGKSRYCVAILVTVPSHLIGR
jgi:hypothetical protein